ncbi:MAG TPA: hypothetical protein VNH22_14310 [Blastocatellia bacterium]|jgi:ribosome-binding factor A|nr:hypothetical protein [Blastocatellia bacterium]
MKKMLSVQKIILSLSLATSMLGATTAATPASGIQAGATARQTTKRQSSTIQENDELTWISTDNGVGIEVKMRGKVQFNEDYTDILSISDGGWVRIKDDRKGPARRLEITPTSGGGFERSYRVNGESRPYDEDAGRWLATVLLDAVRQGGFDASNRVKKIFSQRGAAGVLEEISLLRSDYVKGLYFKGLFKATTLDSASVQRVLREVTREMSSDYEKAQVLMAIAGTYLNDDATRTAYLDAVGTVKSDYERGRVLSALLKNPDLNNKILTHTLKTAAAISSDYEKAQLLMKMGEGKMRDNGVRLAYLETAGSIDSSYERARVLLALLGRNDLEQEATLLVVKSAMNISSDYEKARVLIQVAEMYASDEKVRTALTDAARTIDSSYERGRVLSATHK